MKRMKNRLRRLLAAFLSLLALCCPLTAAAEGTTGPGTTSTTAPADTAYAQVSEKAITFTADDQIAIEPAGQTAFWEYPLLLPGENRQPGTLRLVNASSKTVNFQLEIGLPYENMEALTYLNALYITVKDGDTVLYDGAYCHIADPDGGLQVVMQNWQPGSERVLTVQMRCAFGYDGEPEQASAPIAWGAKVIVGDIQGGAASNSSPNLETPRPVTAVIIIGIAGGLVVICAVAGTVGVVLRRRKGRTPPDDEDGAL